MSDEFSKMDLMMHPVFGLEEQIKMFDSSAGPSQVQKWQSSILEFFTAQGRFKPEEKEKVAKSNYITDKFLKMVKTPIP
jgi:NitT/TauT family transport system substrate-binding protein/sulfonate transport system substrate-binding protein